ncbi:MAG: hypothetical protein GY749_18365 [Desulfobacteraceae bacterium]|nr:hypothetical protein [Desulfobacteraceae bacterium]
MENKNLFLAKGKIKVSAKGYWFTAGGEKGSFGYYPHLKSPDRYPVYPDTQIHGDLRMSASWLSDLCHPTVSKDMTELIFGNPGAPGLPCCESLIWSCALIQRKQKNLKIFLR